MMKRVGGPLPTEKVPDASELLWARSPSDAYQCLIDLVTVARKLRALVTESATQARGILRMFETANDWDDWCRLVDGVDVYYWTPHTARLVSAASDSYPLAEESALTFAEMKQRTAIGSTQPPAYFPRKARGMCVFSEPCLWNAVNNEQSPLSALLWTTGFNVTAKEVWLSLRGVTWQRPGVAAVTWWSDGGVIDETDATVDATFRAERIAFTKWICTASMFLEQEIVTETDAIPERAMRRRAQKLDVDTAPCHVVSLRKTIEREINPSDRDQMVDWSHRWLVRGHWRRQFFPSRGGHAPIWIHPHVKGPDDKPFIGPRPTVFAVSR